MQQLKFLVLWNKRKLSERECYLYCFWQRDKSFGCSIRNKSFRLVLQLRKIVKLYMTPWSHEAFRLQNWSPRAILLIQEPWVNRSDVNPLWFFCWQPKEKFENPTLLLSSPRIPLINYITFASFGFHSIYTIVPNKVTLTCLRGLFVQFDPSKGFFS